MEIDIESNVLLRDIRDAGYAKGFAEGEAKGEAKGQARLLRSQLESKFGKLPAWANKRLAQASADDIARWGAKILTARSIDSALNGK
ncbi:MAG: hypothetical protein FJW39_02885 [Acidobacteria bacterium]|nr:hypothetical protein [Acidobacteriota bacterium]